MLLLLLVAGCGGSDGGTSTDRSAELSEPCGPRDTLIAGEDISDAGRDTPTAALLTWWQSLQFRDVPTARRLYAQGVPTKGLTEAIRKLADTHSRSRPIVREIHVDGARARLLVVIRASSGDCEDELVHETPATFRLIREGTWKQADNRYLEARLRALEDAERAARG